MMQLFARNDVRHFETPQPGHRSALPLFPPLQAYRPQKQNLESSQELRKSRCFLLLLPMKVEVRS